MKINEILQLDVERMPCLLTPTQNHATSGPINKGIPYWNASYHSTPRTVQASNLNQVLRIWIWYKPQTPVYFRLSLAWKTSFFPSSWLGVHFSTNLNSICQKGPHLGCCQKRSQAGFGVVESFSWEVVNQFFESLGSYSLR